MSSRKTDLRKLKKERINSKLDFRHKLVPSVSPKNVFSKYCARLMQKQKLKIF